jgi:hypothetical protein
MGCGRDHEADRVACVKLLNDISKGESLAGVYLGQWAGITQDPELRKALEFVAARETSHGEVFKRRLCEVGEELTPGIDPRGLAFFAPLTNCETSDLDKIRHFEEAFAGIDFFGPIERQIEEGAFDKMSASMLTWYIGEERDSGDVLNAAFECVKQQAGVSGATATSNGVSGDAQAIMQCMTQGFASVERALGELASTLSTR